MFMRGASAMQLNAWTCALETVSDLESAYRVLGLERW